MAACSTTMLCGLQSALAAPTAVCNVVTGSGWASKIDHLALAPAPAQTLVVRGKVLLADEKAKVQQLVGNIMADFRVLQQPAN